MRRISRYLLISVALAATALATAGALPAHATAPGQNGRIAFRRYFNEAQTQGAIFTIRPDGTGERRVTHSPRSKLTTEPDWSPGGHWIVYDVWSLGDSNASRILKIHPNGTGRTDIDGSCTAPCLTDAFPQWSPSGSRIVFQRGLGPAGGKIKVYAIFTMRADGTDVRQITQLGADPTVKQPIEDLTPTWSPDGKRLAFNRTKLSTGHTAVFTIGLDGSGLRRITPWKRDAGQPDWSPDGRWLAFYMNAQQDVALVHPNGTGLHIIASAPFSWSSLSFSPNGNKITVGHRLTETANGDIYTMNMDGAHLQDITNTMRHESAPDWGPRPSS
jgi:Tol biopolymer transport system component